MKLYTLQEIAQMTGVSNRLAHQYLGEGILEGAKYGNSWRVSEKQFEEFHERMTAYSMQRRKRNTGTERAAFFGEETPGANDDANREEESTAAESGANGVPMDETAHMMGGAASTDDGVDGIADDWSEILDMCAPPEEEDETMESEALRDGADTPQSVDAATPEDEIYTDELDI